MSDSTLENPNQFNEKNWEEFQKRLNDPDFVKRIIQEAINQKAIATFLMENILELIDKKEIKNSDSVGELLEVLKLLKRKVSFPETRQLDVIAYHLNKFLSKKEIKPSDSIEELIKFFKNLIKEKEDFLNSYKNKNY